VAIGIWGAEFIDEGSGIGAETARRSSGFAASGHREDGVHSDGAEGIEQTWGFDRTVIVACRGRSAWFRESWRLFQFSPGCGSPGAGVASPGALLSALTISLSRKVSSPRPFFDEHVGCVQPHQITRGGRKSWGADAVVWHQGHPPWRRMRPQLLVEFSDRAGKVVTTWRAHRLEGAGPRRIAAHRKPGGRRPAGPSGRSGAFKGVTRTNGSGRQR